MAEKKSGDKPLIVVKRIRKGGHGGHHGGAWKIAYADFVTAMMAFFLLMWLLGSTTKGDLQGIADYFQTPLKVAMAGGSGSGDSSSILKGGGKDLTRSFGQVKNGEMPPMRKNINFQAAKAEIARQEQIELGQIRDKVSAAIEAKEALKAYRNPIQIDITTEGLRIQIVDAQNRPMFDIGRAVLKDYTRELLRAIGTVLNDVNYKISLAGHTDAAPYASGERGYSNWELSADRANASRRELIAAGMDDRKIVRVVGLASSTLFDAADPFNPSNRRISIVVMNKKTEEALLRDGAVQEVSSAEEASDALAPAKRNP
ncbi:MAG: flagellar motor protein MotB [Burkholderiales bacterium]